MVKDVVFFQKQCVTVRNVQAQQHLKYQNRCVAVATLSLH